MGFAVTLQVACPFVVATVAERCRPAEEELARLALVLPVFCFKINTFSNFSRENHIIFKSNKK